MFNDLAFVVMLSSTNSPVRKWSIFQSPGLIECKSLVLSEGGRKVSNFFLKERKAMTKLTTNFQLAFLSLALLFIIKHFLKESNRFPIDGVLLVFFVPGFCRGMWYFFPFVANMSTHWSEAYTHIMSWGCRGDAAEHALEIKACFTSTQKWDP